MHLFSILPFLHLFVKQILRFRLLHVFCIPARFLCLYSYLFSSQLTTCLFLHASRPSTLKMPCLPSNGPLHWLHGLPSHNSQPTAHTPPPQGATPPPHNMSCSHQKAHKAHPPLPKTTPHSPPHLPKSLHLLAAAALFTQMEMLWIKQGLEEVKILRSRSNQGF